MDLVSVHLSSLELAMVSSGNTSKVFTCNSKHLWLLIKHFIDWNFLEIPYAGHQENEAKAGLTILI